MQEARVGMTVRITQPGLHKHKTAVVIGSDTRNSLTVQLRNGYKLEVPLRFLEIKR